MRLLVIEDNEDIVENIYEYFEKHGHVVDAVRDGLSGLQLAATETFDAIVLDLMLPGLDGYTLCKRLRSDAHIDTPIVMLTAKHTLEDKLKGFEIGADDYLIKPFALPELEVRLLALVRRARGDFCQKELRVADLVFDRETMEVRRGDRKLTLNRIARNILALLMQRSPRVVTRNCIEQEVWGENPPDTDTLRTHMYNLRNVIDKPFEKKLLKTLPREGYRLAADDEPDESTPN